MKSRPLRLRVIAVAPVFAVIALLCWAFASPIGSSPDDDFHLASIWCSGGEQASECESTSDSNERRIPESLANADCYSYQPEESAACQRLSAATVLESTERGDFAGLYPPVFYWTMNHFASVHIEQSAMAMRLVNILLLVGIASALFALLPSHRRIPFVWGLVITSVPLGMFLVASNNPSAWAIISAGTLWVALLGYFESTGWRKAALAGLAVLAAVIGAGARADAGVYSVVAVLAVCMITARWNREWVVSCLVPLIVVGISVFFYFSASQSASALSGLGSGGSADSPLSFQNLLVLNLLEVPNLWVGVFGLWDLGWLDTQLPAVVWVAAFSVFVALVFSGFRWQSTRKILAAVMVLAAMWVVPTYILVQSGVLVGSQVQPRYILPLIILFAGLGLLSVKGTTFRLSATQIILAVVGLSVANSLALHFNIRRYVTGTDVIGWNLNDGAEWWWDAPFSPMFVWVVGSIVYAAFLIAVGWTTDRQSLSHTSNLSRPNASHHPSLSPITPIANRGPDVHDDDVLSTP